MRGLYCFLFMLFAIGMAGQTAHPPRAARHVATDRSAGSDRELEAAIRARFARSKIGADGFQVHVQGGVATLEGRAAVLQHKGTATRLAKTAGAREVVNKIEVSEEARRRASANLAKGRRRVQVKRGEPRSEAR